MESNENYFSEILVPAVFIIFAFFHAVPSTTKPQTRPVSSPMSVYIRFDFLSLVEIVSSSFSRLREALEFEVEGPDSKPG